MKESMSSDKNVVFLVLDSLRTDRVAAYNEDIDFTDHIQQLADQSIVFENAIAQAPWTLPSHASMFTGEYPWDHGTTHARSYFPDDQETVITDFKTAGYTTTAITPNIWITPHKGMTGDFDYVENFLGKADNPLGLRLSKLSTKLYDNLGKLTKRVLGRQLDRAFRLFGVDDSCKSEETVDAVEQYLGQRDPAENFFLYVNLMEPHEPYHPPQKYADKHGVTDKSKIPQRQKDMFTKQDVDFDELEKIYDASVDYTDDLVGRIMDALDANDLTEDTVVVLLSDHGQALGERDGLFGHQFTVIEPVVNTVLMVDHPDHDAGREERPIELRKLHDLLPYYAGIEPSRPDVFEEIVKGGYEFPENFTGYIPKDEWDDYYRQKRYVKRDETKVVKSVDEHGEERYEAYDLDADVEIPVPSDLKRVVDSIGSVAIDDSDRSDGAEPAEDDEVTKRLEALGYR
jgi:arylsulfatase A-like enzyme